jgi:hypothetical protein
MILAFRGLAPAMAEKERGELVEGGGGAPRGLGCFRGGS